MKAGLSTFRSFRIINGFEINKILVILANEVHLDIWAKIFPIMSLYHSKMKIIIIQNHSLIITKKLQSGDLYPRQVCS